MQNAKYKCDMPNTECNICQIQNAFLTQICEASPTKWNPNPISSEATGGKIILGQETKLPRWMGAFVNRFLTLWHLILYQINHFKINIKKWTGI